MLSVYDENMTLKFTLIADHIGRQDRRKSPLDALFGHVPSLVFIVVEILCVDEG